MKLLLCLLVLLAHAASAALPAPQFTCDPPASVLENGQRVASGKHIELPGTSAAMRTVVLKRAGYQDRTVGLTWVAPLRKWRMQDGSYLVAGETLHLQPVPTHTTSSIPLLIAAASVGAWVWRRPRVKREGVDELRLVRRLGEGASGTVYEAERTDGTRWAVKTLPGRAWERFRREAVMAARVHHPGMVKLHSWGQWGDCPYLVMELVEGESLRTVMARGAMTVDESIRYACEILEALAPLHAQGVVHRDLKPENIMVTPGGRLRILDLGSALHSADPNSQQGTPPYMAPEQFDGNVTPATDVYAVGTIAYEMVAGRRPFDQDSVWGLLAQKLTQEPPQLKRVPRHVSSWIERMLAREPADRPGNAAEALEWVCAA